MALLQSPATDVLISDVRNMLNQPDPTNSFWSDSELLVYVNEGIRRYFVELVEIMEGHFTTSVLLDITSGSELVALPSDCFRVKALYRTVTNGYAVLNYVNSFQSNYSTSAEVGGDSYLPSYFFRGSSLVLRNPPTFSQAGGLQLEYVQFPDELITGGDTMTDQISPVFKDLVETYAVYKAKVKESLVSGTDTSALAKANLNDLFMAFKEGIANRSKYPTFVLPFQP